MFGISLFVIGSWVIWIVLCVLSFLLDTPVAMGLRKRLLLLLGSFLIIGGTFFQPWVEFGFLYYINPVQGWLENLIPPDVLSILAAKLGVFWEYIYSILSHLIAPNGLEICLVPSLGWMIRLTFVPILFTAFLALLDVIIGSSIQDWFAKRIVSYIFIIISLLSFFILLVRLPQIDTLGIHKNIEWTLLTTLLGTHLGNGPWFVLCGLLLIVIGGFIELNDETIDDSNNYYGNGMVTW